jgi:hypothetical protein
MVTFKVFIILLFAIFAALLSRYPTQKILFRLEFLRCHVIHFASLKTPLLVKEVNECLSNFQSNSQCHKQE